MAQSPVREFQAGRGAKVVVWKNNDDTFSIQIKYPRFQKDGEWKDATSFFPTDLSSMIHALELAQLFVDRRYDSSPGVS